MDAGSVSPQSVAPGRSEALLVAAAIGGDGPAFSALVSPHLPALYRIAARACGDSTLAEDAVQESLTVAFQTLGRYQPDTSLRAFLVAIAIRRAHTLLRAERRRKKREQSSRPPTRPETPDQALDAAELQDRIREALNAMPKKRRAAALMRLDARLSHTEIAQALRQRPDAARALVSLALRDLRARLLPMEVTP